MLPIIREWKIRYPFGTGKKQNSYEDKYTRVDGSHDMKKSLSKKIGNKIISDVWFTFPGGI